MTDQVENLIIEHLKALRSEIKDLKTTMHDDFKDVKHRLTQVEIQVIGTRRDGVGVQEDVYRQQSSLDRITERIERIEKRLELA